MVVGAIPGPGTFPCGVCVFFRSLRGFPPAPRDSCEVNWGTLDLIVGVRVKANGCLPPRGPAMNWPLVTS